MSKIVVEGHTIETKDIFDIVDLSSSRLAGFKIRMIDKADLIVSKSIPYESYPSDIRRAHAPYDRLRESIEKQWEADKTELKVFKL